MKKHKPITSTDDILEDIYQELVAIRQQGEKEPEKVPSPSDNVKLTGIKEPASYPPKVPVTEKPKAQKRRPKKRK